MLEAAKTRSNPTVQPPIPASQAEETTSSLKPQAPPSSTRGTSSPRTTPVDPQTSSQQPSSPTDIFSEVNVPEVREMVEVVQEFIAISKSNKPRAAKQWSFSLLRSILTSITLMTPQFMDTLFASKQDKLLLWFPSKPVLIKQDMPVKERRESPFFLRWAP
ncbi:hypothetical protein TNCV_3440791 [Trichonephila clavipes]|uniref:Uncharacterized protein n=1 Tax=Trichonephila clavipes TaxID=2585209 RepID=A0A8X7BFQ1_TRICX|nr:hypothetical protein TNCV_3440791 [Trichonephila clavipes]